MPMLLQLLHLLLAVSGGRRRAAAGIDDVQLHYAFVVSRLAVVRGRERMVEGAAVLCCTSRVSRWI